MIRDKIVKLKDITEGIARMVLDLRTFVTVEGVGFNELFKLVPNPFPNPNSFENLEISRLDLGKISFRPDPIILGSPHTSRKLSILRDAAR